MEWAKDKTVELINDIMLRPSLWDVSCKTYRDRVKKADVFRELEDIYLCSRVDIEKKIASLRSQYSRELQKVQKSRRSQSGTHEVYKPKWFAFELLGFLRTGNSPNDTRSNIPSQEVRVYYDIVWYIKF